MYNNKLIILLFYSNKMSLYRVRLEVTGGPIGYKYTDCHYSNWYTNLDDLKINWINDIGNVEHESYERNRKTYIECKTIA